MNSQMIASAAVDTQLNQTVLIDRSDAELECDLSGSGANFWAKWQAETQSPEVCCELTVS